MSLIPILIGIARTLRDELRSNPAGASELRDTVHEIGSMIGLASTADDLVPDVDAAAALGMKVRALREWGRKGKAELVGRPGHWAMRRSELTRLLTMPRVVAVANDANTDRDDVRASIHAAAARAAGGKR